MRAIIKLTAITGFILASQGLSLTAFAEPASEKISLRRSKPWLAQLTVGTLRLGPGAYYQFTDQWALGAHLFEIGIFGAYSLSPRFYLSQEALSFFLEPTLGFSHYQPSYNGPPIRGRQPLPRESQVFGGVELGLEYRFDFGLALELSGGVSAQPQSFFSPTSSPISPVFGISAGWAF